MLVSSTPAFSVIYWDLCYAAYLNEQVFVFTHSHAACSTSRVTNCAPWVAFYRPLWVRLRVGAPPGGVDEPYCEARLGAGTAAVHTVTIKRTMLTSSPLRVTAWTGASCLFPMARTLFLPHFLYSFLLAPVWLPQVHCYLQRSAAAAQHATCLMTTFGSCCCGQHIAVDHGSLTSTHHLR
jgi:hypothetical protein